MGADNERTEVGTAPTWLQAQAPEGSGTSPSSSRAGGAGGLGGGGQQSTWVPSRCFQAIEAHSSGINDVAFEMGGGLLATAGDDSYVKVWDPGSGRQRAVLKVTEFVEHNLGVEYCACEVSSVVVMCSGVSLCSSCMLDGFLRGRCQACAMCVACPRRR